MMHTRTSSLRMFLALGLILILSGLSFDAQAQGKPKKGDDKKTEEKTTPTKRPTRERPKTKAQLEAEAKAAEEAAAKAEKKAAKQAKKDEWKKLKEDFASVSFRVRPVSALSGHYVLMFDAPALKNKRIAMGGDLRYWQPGEVIEIEPLAGINNFNYMGGSANVFIKYAYAENVYAQGFYGQFSLGGSFFFYEMDDVDAGSGELYTGAYKVGLLAGYQYKYGRFLLSGGLGLNYTGIQDRNIEFERTQTNPINGEDEKLVTLESLDYIIDVPVPLLPYDLSPELDLTIGVLLK